MSKLKIEHKPRGTLLYAKGQPADAMYFIVQGTVEITGEQTELVGRGALLGALDFLNQLTRSQSARCITDTDLLVITKNNIISLFQTQPRFGYAVLKAVAAEAVGSEQAKAEPEPAKLQPLTLEQVLPAGHPQFEITAPSEFDNYTFYTNAVCPVCAAEFPAVRLWESRLITKRVAPDFRVLYENMEPLWYYIWVCPSCSYAYPHKQFNKLSHVRALKLRNSKDAGNCSFTFSPRRTLDEVFLSYYLTLNTFNLVEAAPHLFGNLWMRLVWLYEDCDQPEWAADAAEKALQYFQESLVSGRWSDAGDQRLYIIMAELHLRLNQKEEALRCYMEAANLRQGNARYCRLAADRIQDLRSH